VTLQFVDHREQPTERYPFNPERLALGAGGPVQRRRPGDLAHAAPGTRVSHRAAFLGAKSWGEDGGWMRLFRNARVFLG
jgi:phosphoribosylformylglycinamidine synthase